MLVAVLSDTHLRPGRTLPAFVWQHLANVDLILHAGDLTHIGFLEELEAIAPVHAVQGNCDGWDVLLPERDIFKCEDVTVGLIHGDWGKGGNAQDRAYAAFQDSNVDLIIFGHSHTPFMETRNGILMFNPGSPTDKRRQLHYSFGLLDIQKKQIKARHVYF